MKSSKKGSTMAGATLVSKSGSGHLVESIITRPVPPAPAASFSFVMPAGNALIDEGVYSGYVCSAIVLGVQPPMAGGRSVPRLQIAIGFEVLGALAEGVEITPPPVMYRRYNVVNGPKATLPPLLRAILGRDVPHGETLVPANWIGKAVTVTVQHATKTDGSAGARIGAVMRCAVKGLPAMTALPLLYPGAALAQLPTWAQEAIGAALTPAAGGAAGSLPADYTDDDIPQ